MKWTFIRKYEWIHFSTKEIKVDDPIDVHLPICFTLLMIYTNSKAVWSWKTFKQVWKTCLNKQSFFKWVWGMEYVPHLQLILLNFIMKKIYVYIIIICKNKRNCFILFSWFKFVVKRVIKKSFLFYLTFISLKNSVVITFQNSLTITLPSDSPSTLSWLHLIWVLQCECLLPSLYNHLKLIWCSFHNSCFLWCFVLLLNTL